MTVYSASFLAVILGLVPWLATLLDPFLPLVVLPLAIRVLGWAVTAVFLVLYAICARHLTREGRGAYVEFDPPTQFVASGPFRWSRNPIAACVLGMLLGEALAWSSPSVFLLFLAGLPIAHAQVVLMEEPLLRQRFGQAYEEYRRSVPRWIPRRPPM